MIDLFHTLQDGDLGYIKMIAELWGIDILSANLQTAIQSLAESMLEPILVDELISSLPQQAIEALQGLLENDGVLSWALFSNRYGQLRSMGPAKRDRERPDLNPSSATEMLWYRGLIGKAFLDIETESMEYAYIPEDLVPYLIQLTTETVNLLGRPASPKECEIEVLVDDQILDDICTLLAAIRTGIHDHSSAQAFQKIPNSFTLAVMRAASLIEENLSINPETSREFLENGRGNALSQMVEVWSRSEKVNELMMLSSLKFEGQWKNQPLETRKNILEFISSVPEESWWSISAFISAIEDKYPDFQRPAGDYDSWFILDRKSGKYLRGRTSWEYVEGALLKFMICGPLHWLGLLDLAMSSDSKSPSAFRISNWGKKLWYGGIPDDIQKEEDPINILTNGRLRLTNVTPRFVRYQIARFGVWERYQGKEYLYRITPDSMQKASEQGLKSTHLLSLLKRYASGEIPPSFLKALDHWDRFGNQVELISTKLLQVDQAEILSALLNSSAKRYVIKRLNDTTAIINNDAVEKVRDAILQLGYLSTSEE